MRWKESGPSGGPFRVSITRQALAHAPFAVKASRRARDAASQPSMIFCQVLLTMSRLTVTLSWSPDITSCMGDKGRLAMQEEVDMKNRLKVLRAERNWSQAELAGRLDVSRQAVNAIETGKYDPSLPLAFRIGRLFDMPIEEIFDDEHDGE